MENNEIKLKVQSKCENQLPDVETNNNSSHSDQHRITQPAEWYVESKNTLSLQTYVNFEKISNNVQNGQSPEVSNIDQQSRHELARMNELKESVLIEWIKVQNECERNPLPKIRNTNKNQTAISKINIVVKTINDEQEPNLTSLNNLIFASAVIQYRIK